MRQMIALVLVGVILGVTGMNTYLSRRMDELYISREKLKVDLFETEERLKKIEAQWQHSQTPLIREVEIRFEEQQTDQFLEVKLREAVNRLTQDLVGEEVEKVPHSLILHLIDQRLVDVEGKRYRIQVRTVIVAEKVTYILRYAPVQEQDDDEP
jgi:Fe-S cluster biosynthesis and repair protein YggX